MLAVQELAIRRQGTKPICETSVTQEPSVQIRSWVSVARGFARRPWENPPMSDATMNQTDILSRMDDSKITKQHWKIMFISGMGFFTDAYDLFIIGVVI
jgi:hypothetical protein